MKKPDISNMWEMAIRFESDGVWQNFISLIRSKLIPTINELKNECGVEWYCYDIHDNTNGVPIDWEGPQFHIRFENSRNLSKQDLIDLLPKYCEMIQKIKPFPSEISGLEKISLKNEDISEAWKLDGEASEWVLNMINAHKDNQEIPEKNVYQLLHLFANKCQQNVRLR